LENLGDIAYETDSSGNVTYGNKMSEIMTGVPLKDIVGKPFLPHFEKESQEIAIDAYQRTLNGESPEFELTLTSGRICHFKNEPLRDKNGRIIAVFGIARDVTSTKLAEEALRTERDKVQKYFDVAGVMLLAMDVDQKVLLMNKKGCEVLGYDEKDIIGKNWFDNFLPHRLRKKVLEVFNKLVTGEIEPVEYYENPVLTKSGEERIIAWHNTVLRDEKGKFISTVVSGEDISERKRAQEALRDSEERLALALDAE
jgi:PAS domain S-box-containing protein